MFTFIGIVTFAGSNEIVVGQYVKDKANFDPMLYTVVEAQRYIFSDQDNAFYYTQYVFDWLKYLKSSQHIATSVKGEITIKPQIANIPSIASLKEVVGKNRPYAKANFR